MRVGSNPGQLLDKQVQRPLGSINMRPIMKRHIDTTHGHEPVSRFEPIPSVSGVSHRSTSQVMSWPNDAQLQGRIGLWRSWASLRAFLYRFIIFFLLWIPNPTLISPQMARLGFYLYHLMPQLGFEFTSEELHLQQGTLTKDALPNYLPWLQQL